MSGKTKGHFNASGDILDLRITCHILAAAMEYLKMHSINDSPSDNIVANASSAWGELKDQRKYTLNLICGSIVDKYIPFLFNDR